MPRDGTASAVEAVLVDGAGAELLVAMIKEFTMAAVLADGMGTESLIVVFTRCVDVE
jgi:hypothetical protein